MNSPFFPRSKEMVAVAEKQISSMFLPFQTTVTIVHLKWNKETTDEVKKTNSHLNESLVSKLFFLIQ